MANTTTTEVSDCETDVRPPIDRIDDVIAATLVLVTASASFVVNGGAAHVANRLRRIRGPFTRLSISQAVGDCGVLAVYALWTAPSMYTQTPLALTVVGMKLGQLSLLFWYGSAYAMLIIAVNRYFAICRPFSYEKIFNETNTNRMIALNWVVAIGHTLTFFLPGCNYFYDPGYYIWSYDRCTWCGQFNMGFEVYYTGSVFLVTFAVNMATLFGLRKHSRVTTSTSGADEKRRKRREMMFFIQSVINGAVFYVMVISFNIFSTWSEGKWFYFYTTTLAWEGSHATNG